MKCERSFCKGKAYRQYGRFILCRKHDAQMQANRLADLRAEAIDPIGHRPTDDDLYRWVYGLQRNYVR